MTFNQLRTFVEVATAGSVIEAATTLMVSPPAVSAAVGSIEKELGVALVERAGRGLVVTPAGVVFARYARQVLALLETAKAATAEALDPERGQLRLAAVTTAGEHVVPRFLASFRDRHSHAGITLEVGNRDRVWEALESHEADLAVGGRPPGGGRFVTLATRPNVLVLVAAGTGTPSVRDVDMETLSRSVVLLREGGSGTRGTAEELLEELGVESAHADPRIERRHPGVGAGGLGHHPHITRRRGSRARRGHARGMAVRRHPPPAGLARRGPGPRAPPGHRRPLSDPPGGRRCRRVHPGP